jgi:GntR family transcriptional regulator, rspAB operon transcriptional repressor
MAAGTNTVLERLRQDILSCEIAPGTEIFEQQLAQKFGVSKSPVRDALIRLQEQELVEVRPRTGYRVRPISIVEAGEMYEMRQIYERECVARAIDHASDSEIDGLHEHLTEEAFWPTLEWIALNRRFHSAIAAASGNTCLADASNKLNDRFDRFTVISVGQLEQPVDFTRFNDEHRAIVDAMARRDKRAALAAMRAHIVGSRARTMQALNSAVIVP